MSNTVSNIKVYGIANCDTVKKARRWFEQTGLDYEFCDFRKDGINDDDITTWYQSLGFEQLINQKSSSWRQLDEQQRLDVASVDKCLELIQLLPTLIKRPLVVYQKGQQTQYHVGFKESQYQTAFL